MRLTLLFLLSLAFCNWAANEFTSPPSLLCDLDIFIGGGGGGGGAAAVGTTPGPAVIGGPGGGGGAGGALTARWWVWLFEIFYKKEILIFHILIFILIYNFLFRKFET